MLKILFLFLCLGKQVVYFEVAHPDTNPAGQGNFKMNFCRGNRQTVCLVVQKKLNFMAASKPMFLDSQLFPSIFLYFEFIVTENIY